METLGKVFLTIVAVGWLLIALAVVSGCGGCPEGEVESLGLCVPVEQLPVATISCDTPVDVPRCFVVVRNAEEVAAYYGKQLAWEDIGITEERVVYTDAPPILEEFVVVACNEFGCIEEHVDE